MREALKDMLPTIVYGFLIIYACQIVGTIFGFAADTSYYRNSVKTKSEFYKSVFVPFYPLVKGFSDRYNQLEDK